MPRPLTTRPFTAAEVARKPLLGFGVTGWIALPILIALIVVLCTGYDLRYQIQKVVVNTLGVRALMDFTIYGLVHSTMAIGPWPPVGRFGPLAAAIVLIALFVHPRPIGAPRTAMIWALGLLGPALMMRVMTDKAFRRLCGDVAAWEVASIVWLFAAATAVWLATRSWRVGLLAAGLFAIPLLADIAIVLAQTGDMPYAFGQLQFYQPHLSLIMHAGLAGVLWTWAIRARLNVIPDHACPQCGYDVRGLPPPCPECGHARPG